MKKFFLTCILTACLLLVSCVENSSVCASEKNFSGSQTVTAAAKKPKIDWEHAPRFDNFENLVEYLNDRKYALKTTVPVVCVNGFIPDSKKIPELRPIFFLKWTTYTEQGQNLRILYEITNYPGERVAWAYLHKDTSFLNDDEMKLYAAAVDLVNDAKNFSSDPLYQELYIHDRLTGKTVYYNKEPQPKYARFKTAFGVLFDGKANCQGYADAFYMLATMCGFHADKVNGYVKNNSHTWNTITFGDKSYFVDVTWDDSACKLGDENFNAYIYFNAPTQVMTNHRWYTAHVPKNLCDTPDKYNFYRAKEYATSNGKYFGTSFNFAEDALNHIANRIAKQGYKISRVEAPYSAHYFDVNNSLKLLTKNFLLQLGWSGTVTMNIERHGNYMYFTVKATKK